MIMSIIIIIITIIEYNSVISILMKNCLSSICYFNNYIINALGSSVSVVTELRAERSGMESRWGRDFPLVQTGRGAHPASCKIGTGSFPGIKCSRGVLLTTHPF